MKGRESITEKLPESIESSKFASQRARMSGEFDSRKDSHSAKLERRPWIFLKLGFAMITSLSELYLRFRRCIMLVQTKKVISMNYGSSTSSWNHGDEWGLAWCLWCGIYKSIPTWTHSKNSLAAEPLSLNICSHGTSLKWSQSILVSVGIVISYAMKQRITFWVWQKVNGEHQNFPVEGKPL